MAGGGGRFRSIDFMETILLANHLTNFDSMQIGLQLIFLKRNLSQMILC
jgi:hypothetical protein